MQFRDAGLAVRRAKVIQNFRESRTPRHVFSALPAPPGRKQPLPHHLPPHQSRLRPGYAHLQTGKREMPFQPANNKTAHARTYHSVHQCDVPTGSQRSLTTTESPAWQAGHGRLFVYKRQFFSNAILYMYIGIKQGYL